MKLLIFRHLWGLSGPGTSIATWQDALPVVATSDVGYSGVEFPIFMAPDAGELREALQRHALDYVPMVFTYGDDVNAHLESLQTQLQMVQQVPHRFVVCHGGRDSFSEAEAIAFFSGALALEADLGPSVAHETHRGRILYNPWTTARMLERFDQLKLNCDYSHWVVVCERVIDDLLPILEACAERALHVHARVGFENGPQVSDPRAPEWLYMCEAHERWWDLIWESQRRRGYSHSTLTAEFGPPSYQPVAPHTSEPLAALVAICDWMARRQRTRFDAFTTRDADAKTRAMR